eukprot:2736704-Alexandrium_andersonii.AAC.1
MAAEPCPRLQPRRRQPPRGAPRMIPSQWRSEQRAGSQCDRPLRRCGLAAESGVDSGRRWA